MIGFKQRTADTELRKWEKNLNINNDVLTTQVDFKFCKDPTEKEERKMVRDIKKGQR